MNRGFYERYTTESVLVAARNPKKKINEELAKRMCEERKELFMPDLVMVPSIRSATGWKFVQQSHIGKR